MPQGYLCLVLHAHLPFVRHPEYDDFLEEDWFYEAITETYIPLLDVYESLDRDGVDWRVTMSITPTLAAMFSDPLLQYRYVRHIDNLIALSCKEIERHFGKRPQGIWLPECGYAPGVEQLLRDSGIRYFFTDTHGVLFAEPRPKFGVYAPIVCPNSGVAALARDTESSKQVWSAVEGYPGDYNYREFYRDVGFDLDYEYLSPHLHQTGIRSNLGMKYYKITGRTDHKEPYNQRAALDKAAEHAGNFMFNREKQVEWLSGAMDGRPALIVAPYDAELYGHWWFEGPDWINFLLRKLHYDQQTVKAITIPEYLNRHPKIQVSKPSLSSWGYKGYCEVWLEGSNDWIYRHLHEGADRMVELAQNYAQPSPLQRRALNQAARELLLSQSSDWAFILKTGTMMEYAQSRTRVHVLNFNHLYEQIKHNDI